MPPTTCIRTIPSSGTRADRNSARVVVDGETVGHVRSETRPRRDAVTTKFVNAKYGAQIARSVGFDNEDVFIALDARGRRISSRDYDRIETAAMAVARRATA